MKQRALPILFQFYQEYAGRYKYRKMAAEMICGSLGVSLRGSAGLGPLGGFLGEKEDGKYVITAAEKAEPEYRAFVIYHELAHWQLGIKMPFFNRRRDGVLRSIDLREEYWCDAFATAMLFAWVGVILLFEENYKDFFNGGTTGIEVNQGEDLKYPNAVRDIHNGSRILGLNKRNFAQPNEKFVVLGNDLIALGTKKAEALVSAY